MGSPAGPIYSSTLHRRDRAWGPRRRVRLRVRLMVWGSASMAVAGMLLVHFT